MILILALMVVVITAYQAVPLFIEGPATPEHRARVRRFGIGVASWALYTFPFALVELVDRFLLHDSRWEKGSLERALWFSALIVAPVVAGALFGNTNVKRWKDLLVACYPLLAYPLSIQIASLAIGPQGAGDAGIVFGVFFLFIGPVALPALYFAGVGAGVALREFFENPFK